MCDDSPLLLAWVPRSLLHEATAFQTGPCPSCLGFPVRPASAPWLAFSPAGPLLSLAEDRQEDLASYRDFSREALLRRKVGPPGVGFWEGRGEPWAADLGPFVSVSGQSLHE